MPDDLNNKMDEMLRDYAQKRRNIPDPRIHPATRKMLQGEVSRVYKQETREAASSPRMLRFWPQYAIGLAAVLLLLGILIPGQLRHRQLQPQSKPTVEKQTVADKEAEQLNAPAQAPAEANLKKLNERAEEAESKDTLDDFKTKEAGRADTVRLQTAPAAPPSSRGVQLGLEPARKTEAIRTESDVVLNEQLLKPQTQAAPSPQENRRGYFLKSPIVAQDEAAAEKAKTDATTLAVSAEKRPPNLLALKRASELTNLGGALRSKFVQVTNQATAGPSFAAAHPLPSPVLTSFQLEQLGDNLKLIDRDGSVYDGQVLTNATPADVAKNSAAVDAQLQTAARPNTAAIGGAQQSQVYFLDNSLVNNFRASGVNRTLGKPVVVTGQLYERTNQSQAAQNNLNYQNQYQQKPANVIQAGAQLNQLNQLNQLSVANRAIVGTATVGDTNQVPIQAISNE